MLQIKPDFTIEDIKKDMYNFLEEAEDHMVASLKQAGKKMVDRARLKTRVDGGFNNITWDLRGSIGYVLIKDHDVIDTYFPQTSKGSEGVKTGIAYAREIAFLQDDGDIMLVVVAGMEYAYFVEVRHDRDVISGSINELTKELKALL